LRLIQGQIPAFPLRAHLNRSLHRIRESVSSSCCLFIDVALQRKVHIANLFLCDQRRNTKHNDSSIIIATNHDMSFQLVDLYSSSRSSSCSDSTSRVKILIASSSFSFSCCSASCSSRLSISASNQLSYYFKGSKGKRGRGG
jgi:hypothetical protein